MRVLITARALARSGWGFSGAGATVRGCQGGCGCEPLSAMVLEVLQVGFCGRMSFEGVRV